MESGVRKHEHDMQRLNVVCSEMCFGADGTF